MSDLFTSNEPWVWLTGLFLFLLAYGLSTVFIVRKKKKTAGPQQLVSLYMALKVVRLLIFIGVILVYMLAVKIETKRFVLVAVALYVLYLLFDTLYLTYSEKRLKKK